MEGFGTDDAPAHIPGPAIFHRFEGLLVALSAACIIGMGALITLTVVTRTFFLWSVPDDTIIIRELMISAVILPLAFVTAGRAHIMVEVFTSMMPSRAQPWLNLLSSLVGLLTLLPIMYGGWLELLGVIEDEAYFFGDMELPEWPGRLAFFVGYITFVIRLALLLVYDASVVFRRPGGPSSSDTGEGG